MTGRRRYPRYLMNSPLEGSLRVREEVTIETWEGNEVSVLSTVPVPPAQHLTLELPGHEGGRVQATVQESRPIVTMEGAIRHRLLLAIDAATAIEPPNGDRKAP
jgi:hypothetical protein